MVEYIIDEDYESVRVDRFLRKHLKNINLSEIYKMLRKGKIKINNKKISQDYRLVLGDIISICLPETFKENEEEKFINLNQDRKEKLKEMIVFENEKLFIVNKSLGDVVHKGSGHNISLLEEFRSYYSNSNINFVNRIDKLTSGLLIGAKNIKTAREIAKEIQSGNIVKKYYILVHGNIEKDNFILENYLKKDEEKVIVSDIEKEGYKKSITYFRKIKEYDKCTLLEAELKTGRTHQLRAQLNHIGNTIVGDTKYGKNEKENIMYLFSYYLKIDLYNLEIKLEVPNYFKK
ncbi:RluA family pseudouridine synthase [Fusobacterium simiae]|uniref:RluA family pseudouridine synthase n=1 Tax=Fusobacterium simiae TaxID=855 RepID=A0ABT4DIH7_FUSSI|nr:RluA family pseudouridine synthase [Fusobacterium simiae]MCY7008396.1 RluA family pseudouridine synthase [Fusobacterium simiae]